MSNLIRGVALCVVVIGVACVVQQQPQPSGGAASSDGSDPTGCGAACDHYLACKGINDEQSFVTCNNECQTNTELDPATVAQYPSLDCATAIQMVEGDGGSQGGGEQGNGSCTADCTSCVWDGSSCYSNSMAAMGTVIECEACCCAQGGGAPRWD